MLRACTVTSFAIFIFWSTLLTIWWTNTYFRAMTRVIVGGTSENASGGSNNRGQPDHPEHQKYIIQRIGGARIDPEPRRTPRLATSWAERDKVGQSKCPYIFPSPPSTSGQSSPFHITPSVMWNLLLPQILNASYFPPPAATIPSFREWVNTLLAFYTTDKLRRSMAHPPSKGSVRKLLQVAAKRLQYLVSSTPTNRTTSTTENRASVVEPPGPIRIMVLGGSVAVGVGCSYNSGGLSREKTNEVDPDCPWPSRLQQLFNQVLFRGQPVVEVTNAAIRAQNTEVGVMLMEYRLLPQLQQEKDLPHIVISAYSPNDALNQDLNATLQDHLPRFVRATHNLNRCDDDLPLVVLADDMYGDFHIPGLEQTASLYKIASWYNVMAVVYANVARHGAATHHVHERQANPLFGSPASKMHLGMGYHIGMAWTILFNLLVAMHEACSDTDVEDSTKNADTNNPVISKDAPAVALRELPTKFRGKLASTTTRIRDEWLSNLNERDVFCRSQQNQPSLVPSENESSSSLLLPYSTSACVYAWAVGPPTGMDLPEHVTAALEPLTVFNHGWVARGHPIRPPRTALYADATNATMSLQLHNVTQETKHLTILSMKSYDPTFVGSKLNVTVQVLRALDTELALQGSERYKNAGLTTQATDQYVIEGYHDILTSVYFPHKFRLPGNGARVGDSIRIQLQLVSGQTFNIAGIALCRF